MKKYFIFFAATSLLLLVRTAFSYAEDYGASEPFMKEDRDRLKEGAVLASGGEYEADVQIIKEHGGRLDWCAANNKVAFDKRGADGYYDVYLMNPDGSGEQCLTCDTQGKLPRKHNGNPAWYPSGKYIVFQSEKDGVPPRFDKNASPGAGTWNDLWVMTSDGKEFYKIVDLPLKFRPSSGTLHAHFSSDGEKLLWSERIDGGIVYGSMFGRWVLKLADFIVDEKGPRLANIKTYHPGKQWDFYESHGFSPDGAKILFSADAEPGQTSWGLDIYEMDLKTEEVRNLTKTIYIWDEHAHYSPDGTKIIWMSNNGYHIGKGLKTEFWMMDRDGSNQRQLTFFNTPGHAHFLDFERGAVAADGCFSPDGKSYMGLVNKPQEWDPDGIIVLLTLKEAD